MVGSTVLPGERTGVLDASAPETRGMNETNISPKQQAKKENARISRPHEQPGGTPGPEEEAGERPQTSNGVRPAEAAKVAVHQTPRSRSQRFPRAFRLRQHREFLTVQRKGKRQTTPHFVVITRPKKNLPSRLGITTSRKVGIAPDRNRIRRLVRECFRRRGQVGPPSDVVVIALPGAAGLTYREVADEIVRALSAAWNRRR
jgi:ribonuclease P protein component